MYLHDFVNTFLLIPFSIASKSRCFASEAAKWNVRVDPRLHAGEIISVNEWTSLLNHNATRHIVLKHPSLTISVYVSVLVVEARLVKWRDFRVADDMISAPHTLCERRWSNLKGFQFEKLQLLVWSKMKFGFQLSCFQKKTETT